MKELHAALSLLRMRRHLHLSPEVLLSEQTRKLRETVQHAYSTTPYYRNLFDAAGVHPRDIRTLADLPKVPLTRKEALLSVPSEDRTARGTNIRKCLKLTTSRSTGARLDLFITPSEKLRRVKADLRALLANGYSFLDTTCLILTPRMIPAFRYWFQHLGLLRRRYISLYEDMETKVRTLAEGNYDVICGLTSEVFFVAEAMLERGIAPAPPKLLVTSGEVMDPTQHRTIHQAFGRAPTDFYGSVEFGYIAWQCPERQGYHANADLFVLELVKDGTIVGPGEEGELVITDLTPRAMPLIRYATDDWSSSSGVACPCGTTLPTLSHISGRVWDFLLLPSGEKVSPYVVALAMSEVPGMKNYQVTQTSRSEVFVRFARHPAAGEDPSPAIVRKLQSLVGESIEIRLEEVPSIARPGSKFRVVENALLRGERPT